MGKSSKTTTRSYGIESQETSLQYMYLRCFIFIIVSQGEQTYTPRLIALDLPGSLKTLKREGTLYDTHTGAKDVPAWCVMILIIDNNWIILLIY